MRRLVTILVLTLWTCSSGCGKSDDGPVTPAGECADLRGNWTLALVDLDPDVWFPMISIPFTMAQSSDCKVSAESELWGDVLVSGWATTDSLFLKLESAIPNSRSSDVTLCKLARQDQYHYTGFWATDLSDGPATLLGPAPDCSGVVELSIGPGLTPVFDWKPNCAVSFLLIETADGGDMWFVGNTEDNLLEPPITYGETPAGGVFADESYPLVHGETYSVFLYKYLEEGYLIVDYATISP